MESTYLTKVVVDQLVAILGRLYLVALLGSEGKNLLLAFLDTGWAGTGSASGYAELEVEHQRV